MDNFLKYYFRIVYIVTLFIALALVGFAFNMDAKYSELNQSHLQKLEFEGTIQVGETGEEIPLTQENLQKIGAAEHVIVKGHFTQDIKENEQIFVYLRRIGIKFYQNGDLKYSYGDAKDYPPYTKAEGNVWGNFYTEGIDTKDAIVMEFYNPYPKNSSNVYERCIQQMYAGEKMQLFLYKAGQSAFEAIAAAIVLLLGLELLCVALSLWVVQVNGMSQFFYCGLLFLVASIWLIIDYDYISLVVPYPIGWEILDTIAFICIPTLSIRYARCFMVTKVKEILRVLEAGLLGMIVSYIVMQAIGILDGETMQETFMNMLPVIISIIFICLLLEIWRNKKIVSRLVLGSGNTLIIFAFIDYVQYKISEVYVVSLFGVGFVLFIIVQYAILIELARSNYQRVRKARAMEKEVLESKIAIMLSQIQPHFLYNSISSIQELCLCEPKKAHDALARFAHFLRGNMDSLSSTSPIPFEQELKHVNNYLALEQIRFEERLNVQYEIEKDGFFIPALTIQPIVENAVRYGISKKKEGGTLIISTGETKKEIIVTVQDDGVGFDMNDLGRQTDNRTHIGLENVRNRLESQCNGRMEITSKVGEGTTVQLILPK